MNVMKWVIQWSVNPEGNIIHRTVSHSRSDVRYNNSYEESTNVEPRIYLENDMYRSILYIYTV